jgi:hypothetical protein
VRRGFGNSPADNSLTSLSQRVGHYLDAEKQKDDRKPAPTEIRNEDLGPSFSHGVILYFKFPSASSYKVESTDRLSLIKSHFSSMAVLGDDVELVAPLA